MRVLLLVGALLSSPLLTAQTAAPAAPADPPHIEIDTVGPDGWRMRLGPTNLGSMLESDQGKALWQPYAAPMLEIWQQFAGKEGAEGAEALTLERLLGYGGRIRAAIWLDSEGRRREPANCIAMVLDGDGRTDMAAVAADLHRALYAGVPGEWREVDLEGEQFAVRVSEDVEILSPIAHGGALLLAASTDGDLPLALRRARQLASTSGPVRPDSPALKVRLAFGAMIEQAFAAKPAEDTAWMKAIGLQTVGDGTIAVATAGPRVRIDYSQQFTADERGLFGALFPDASTVPSLLAAVPPEVSWAVGHFDLLKLYDAILAAIDAEESEHIGPAREEVKKELGIDLGPDLFAHMTDEVLFSMHEREDFVDRPERTPWTLAWRLTDAEAFERGLETMLPHFKPFFTRERITQHGEISLYRYGNFLSYDVWMAIGNGIFAMSGGADAEEHITALLDRSAALPAEPLAAGTIPDNFADLRRHLPPGTQGYGMGSTAHIARTPTTLWLGLMRELLPIPMFGRPPLSPDEEAERSEAMAALLEQHNLHVARSATGWTERTWQWRLFW